MRKRNKKIAILTAIIMTASNLVVSNNVFTLHAEKITTQENIKGKMASTSKKSTVTLVMKKNNKNKLILYVGDSIQLKLSGSAKWFSDKKAVATINSKGVVKAKKAGFATITAKVKRSKYTCRITVNNKKIKQTPIPTTSVNNLMTETPIPKITIMPTISIPTQTIKPLPTQTAPPVPVKTVSPEPVATISAMAPVAMGEVNNGPLNVRVGAGKKYNRLIYNEEYVSLPIGHTVQIKEEIIGEDDNWYYIEFSYNNVLLKGYVMAQYVTKIENNLTYSASPVTTKTPSSTYTPTPSPTYKPTPSPTYTPTPSPTYTPTPSPTFTPPPSPTFTPSPTFAPTPSPTYTPTPSPTYTPTPSPTFTPTPSPTYTPTPSPTYTPTPSPTFTPPPSPTYTPTPSPTYTPTLSPIFTPSASPTYMPTPTPVAVNERSVVTDLKEGYYVIKSSLGTNYVLGIEGNSTSTGANCRIYKRNTSIGQIFYIKKVRDGYYTISAKCSNMYLDVWENGMTPGTNICQSVAHGGANQQWKLYKNNSLGTYQFQALSNSLYMEVAGDIVWDGSNVRCNRYSNSSSQNWYLEYVGT